MALSCKLISLHYVTMILLRIVVKMHYPLFFRILMLPISATLTGQRLSQPPAEIADKKKSDEYNIRMQQSNRYFTYREVLVRSEV